MLHFSLYKLFKDLYKKFRIKHSHGIDYCLFRLDKTTFRLDKTNCSETCFYYLLGLISSKK